MRISFRRESAPHLRTALVAVFLFLVTGCAATDPDAIVVWIANESASVGAETPPSSENDVFSASRQSVTLDAAVNDVVALQLVVKANRIPAGPFDVRLTDLTGRRERISANRHVRIYRADYVTVSALESWYPEHLGRTATAVSVPDALVPWDAPRGGGPLRVNSHRNEIVWIDIEVPATVPPDEYIGTIEVTSAAAGSAPATPAFRSEIRLNVLPVAIPGPASLPLICRLDPVSLFMQELGWSRRQAEETRLVPGTPAHEDAIELLNRTMELFHGHRATPVLWHSFPRYGPAVDGTIEIDWEAYDALVGGWLDGSAFSDQAGLAAWPIPASLEHPDPTNNGGFDSPRYARLVATYLADCARHFGERGWKERAFVRLKAPAALTAASVEDLRRIARILRQSETDLRLVAHVPARSMRGLGWVDAPPIDLPGVSIWAPPAMQFEPGVMAAERALGRASWFIPDQPPYSPVLSAETRACDPCVLAWQSHRYDCGAVWIEDAADVEAAESAGRATAGLLYPGRRYGLEAGPVPSIRLKRLRRGLLDFELLRLLETSGKSLFAQRIAEEIVPWAFTDACLDHLLNCRDTGWPRDPAVLDLARKVMLQELANTFEPAADGRDAQITNLARMARLLNRLDAIRPAVRGVRLQDAGDALQARVMLSLSNRSERSVAGKWTLPSPPIGWEMSDAIEMSVRSGARGLAALDLRLTGIAYDVQGVYPFELRYDSQQHGSFDVPARLAVAACPFTDRPPTVDGDVSDWMRTTNNAAGAFQLVRGESSVPDALPGEPTLPTEAYFCMDGDRLFVGVRCSLRGPGGAPQKAQWRADNVVDVDGIIPWGQDVVEILIEPRNLMEGGPSDLYCIQIKPSGLIIARTGCKTEPPVGRYSEWDCDARAAVSVQRDAWVVELSIPLADFGDLSRSQRIWGLNVTRLDSARGEYSSWSGARGDCYSPQSLGNMLLQWP